MSRVPEPIRELRPHAIWSGIEFLWKLVEALVIASLLALLQYLRSKLDLVTIIVIFLGSLAALALGALRARAPKAGTTEATTPADKMTVDSTVLEDLQRRAGILPQRVEITLRSTTLACSTDPAITYKSKVRAVFTNESEQSIEVRPLSWTVGPDDVPPQYPFGYKYQTEKTIGSWKSAEWNKQELSDAVVGAGGTFTFYVGLDQSIAQNDLEKRRAAKRLGIVTIPIRISGKEYIFRERI